MSPSRRTVLAALLAVPFATAALAQTPPPPVRMRVTLFSLNGDVLGFTTSADTKFKATITPTTGITAVVPASLDAIKPGSFIGTAARPGPNDTLVALEVHVFPESMRGMGEGYRPYDLGAGSSMTNGTVGTVTGTQGRSLTVGYKGGQQTVFVPADAPIVGFEPGDRSLLVPGARAIIFARKADDGSLTLLRILVGKNGLTPPM